MNLAKSSSFKQWCYYLAAGLLVLFVDTGLASISGSSPNGSGDTVIDQNTVWDGETVVLGGETLIGGATAPITVTWNNCSVTARNEIIVDREYPPLAPVTFIITNSTVTLDVPVDTGGFTLNGAHSTYSHYSTGSTLIAKNTLIQGTSSGTAKNTGLKVYSYGTTPVGLQLNHVTFKWLGGGSCGDSRRAALNAKGGNYWKEGSCINNCHFIENYTAVALTDLPLVNCSYVNNWMATFCVDAVSSGTVDGYYFGLYYSKANALYEDVEIKNGFGVVGNPSYAMDQFDGNDNAVFRRIHVHDGYNGIVVAGAKGDIYEDCIVHDVTAGALYLQTDFNASELYVQGNTFRRNEVYNADAGITCAHGLGNTWEDNHVHNCVAGVVCSGSSDTFRNNLIEHCTSGICLQGETSLGFVGCHVLENNSFVDISDVEISLFTSRFAIIRNQAMPVRVKSNPNIEARFEWTNLPAHRNCVLTVNSTATYSFHTNAAGAGGVNIVNSGKNTYDLVVGTETVIIDEDNDGSGNNAQTGNGRIRPYPNPYIKNKNTGNRIIFGNLPGSSTVRIYALTGEPLTAIRHDSVADGGSETWNISSVASGVYFYSVESPKGNEKGKVSIIK